MMLKIVFEVMPTHDLLGWYATGCVVLASVVKVAFSVRLFGSLFLGREPDEVRENFHPAGWAVQLPPLVLAAAALLFGMMPGLLDGPFQRLAVEGLNRPEPLQVWHGFTREAFVSAFVIIPCGFALYALGHRTGWRWLGIPRALQFDRAFERGVELFSRFTQTFTRGLRADQPVDYLPIVIGFTVALVGGCLGWQLAGDEDRRALLTSLVRVVPDALRSFVGALIALAVIGVVLLRRWTTQLIALSVAGFLLCFYFVLYRAPDLALTQILVEVVTLFLILILLGRFPRSAERGATSHRQPRWRQGVNVVLALGMGGIATTFVLLVSAEPARDRLGGYFLANTVRLAEGRNAVNTILVDFRGFDTLGELVVLLVAMLGGLGLLMRYRRSPAEYREGPMGPPGFGASDEPRENNEGT